jgi:hypothetical protein
MGFTRTCEDGEGRLPISSEPSARAEERGGQNSKGQTRKAAKRRRNQPSAVISPDSPPLGEGGGESSSRRERGPHVGRGARPVRPQPGGQKHAEVCVALRPRRLARRASPRRRQRACALRAKSGGAGVAGGERNRRLWARSSFPMQGHPCENANVAATPPVLPQS